MATNLPFRLFNVAAVDGLMDPDTVATVTLEAMKTGKFLVLPHPEVELYLQRKTGDYDRWLSGMRRLQESLGL